MALVHVKDRQLGNITYKYYYRKLTFDYESDMAYAEMIRKVFVDGIQFFREDKIMFFKKKLYDAPIMITSEQEADIMPRVISFLSDCIDTDTAS